MRKQRVLLLILLCLLCASPVFAIKITGAIYDHDLSPIKKTIITINTSPEQTKVSQYGGYYFIVEPGTYQITATLSRNQITKEIASETITITENGEFARDLFVYPDLIIQEEFEDTITNRLQNFFAENGIVIGTVFGAIIILLLFTVFGTKYIKLLFKRELKEYIQEQKIKKQEKKEIPISKDVKENKGVKPLIIPQSIQEKTDKMIESKILKILEIKTDHICTQKEIRREFRLSEAKISLILTQMSEKRLIQKIKQGRRNMIQLRK